MSLVTDIRSFASLFVAIEDMDVVFWHQTQISYVYTTSTVVALAANVEVAGVLTEAVLRQQ